MHIYAITITYSNGATKHFAQEGTTATDAIALVSLREHRENPSGLEVKSVSLSGF